MGNMVVTNTAHLQKIREESRLDAIREIRDLGCPHGCSYPCPFDRRLDSLPVRPPGPR